MYFVYLPPDHPKQIKLMRYQLQQQTNLWTGVFVCMYGALDGKARRYTRAVLSWAYDERMANWNGLVLKIWMKLIERALVPSKHWFFFFPFFLGNRLTNNPKFNWSVISIFTLNHDYVHFIKFDDDALSVRADFLFMCFVSLIEAC